MRCSVCGRRTRYHRRAEYALCAKVGGKWTEVSPRYLGSRCGAVRLFQDRLLAGHGTLRKVRGINDDPMTQGEGTS